MDRELEILLTNDDGIESDGLAAAYNALTDVGDVTVVAPADDQSMMGRALSTEVGITKHERGFAINGTPADCVVAGIQGLELDPDLVVAGINRGANMGGYVLGRSGTVSAAVEAAFFDIPAIATSLYIPTGEVAFHEVEVARDHYQAAANALGYLASNALEAGIFESADYLNVNAPVPGEADGSMHITRPSQRYEMSATHNGDSVTLHDRIWDKMNAGEIDEPIETDRGAVMSGVVSVSPLTAPHASIDNEPLQKVVDTFSLRRDIEVGETE